MTTRLSRLREAMREAGVGALLVTGAANRRYLSGFSGSSGYLLVDAERATLFTDGRYVEQAESEVVEGVRVARHGRPHQRDLFRWLEEANVKELAFEAQNVTVAEWRAYSEAFTGVTLTPTEGIVERLRLRKDEGEIAAIRRACAITDQALESLRREIRVGMAERTLALKLEVRMREAGAEGAAFPFIVASGARSALPHGAPTERRVEAGDLLTFDVGAVVDGYHSDMTRTYFVHHIEDRARAVYDVVLEALELGVGRVRPGTVAREVDEAVRTFIAGRGYGEAFVHSTGHGVGLEIHEGPLLASTGEVVLEEGMVVTVEPGVYLPGFGGVRIEETVVVRKRGPEILTRAERAPTVVGG